MGDGKPPSSWNLPNLPGLLIGGRFYLSSFFALHGTLPVRCAASRVDALVWAMADLFPRMVKPQTPVDWDDVRGSAGSWLL